MASDPSLYYTTTIILDVQSSPLIARIEGGEQQVIGAEQTLKLDASASIDPDQSSEPERFTWTATDSEGKSVFYRDSNNKFTRLQMASQAKVEIDVAKTLKPNSKYVFYVRVKRPNKLTRTNKSTTDKNRPNNPIE